MLDLTANGELNPLGYNHALMRAQIFGKEFDNSLINGYANDLVSSANLAALAKESLGAHHPDGLSGITLVNQRNATGEAVQAAMIERA